MSEFIAKLLPLVIISLVFLLFLSIEFFTYLIWYSFNYGDTKLHSHQEEENEE